MTKISKKIRMSGLASTIAMSALASTIAHADEQFPPTPGMPQQPVGGSIPVAQSIQLAQHEYAVCIDRGMQKYQDGDWLTRFETAMEGCDWEFTTLGQAIGPWAAGSYNSSLMDRYIPAANRNDLDQKPQQKSHGFTMQAVDAMKQFQVCYAGQQNPKDFAAVDRNCQSEERMLDRLMTPGETSLFYYILATAPDLGQQFMAAITPLSPETFEDPAPKTTLLASTDATWAAIAR